MPRNQQDIPVPKGTWVELTDGEDAETIKFQVHYGEAEIRRGSETQPDDQNRGWIYTRGQGENGPLSDISETETGNRVWAKGRTGDEAIVLVDHA